jgi:hypothetical protein
MTLAAAAAALLLSTSPPACALPPLRGGPLPWKPGETLGFDIDVMGVVKAGSLSLAAERPILGQIAVQARVRNTSVFAKVRKVSGTAFSWLDQKTLRPARYRDDLVENGVHKVTDARMPERASETTIETRWGDQRQTVTFAREGAVIDLLAVIYYLRAADLRPGDPMCFDLVANRRYWRFRATVASRPERVESAAGIFDTLRIDATVTRADNPAAKRPLHIWISTDTRRLPVAAVSEIDLGPVRAMLSRASP